MCLRAYGKEEALTTSKATGTGQDPSRCIVSRHGEGVFIEKWKWKKKQKEDEDEEAVDIISTPESGSIQVGGGRMLVEIETTSFPTQPASQKNIYLFFFWAIGCTLYYYHYRAFSGSRPCMYVPW